ncbi:xanthine dehydrogenase family protein molybdopterin-binding subunit [Alphaproteobacteria bacterium LSUCC0684]
MNLRFGIGQPVRRLEDASLLTGQGRYTDDHFPGQGLAVAFLRAPFAHARLTELDLSAARTAEGVHLVAGQADLDADQVGEIHCQHYVPWHDGRPMARTTKPPMVRDINRYAGDIVAMVVADTRQQARDAIELITMDFEPMEAVTDIYDALAETAPRLYPEYPGNLAFEWHAGRLEEARQALAEAEGEGRRIISVDVINNRILTNAMETRPMVAMPLEDGEDGLRIWTGSQGVVGLGEQIAAALNMERDQVHLLTDDVGGGFGFKIFLHPEQVCIAWAARKLGRMVRWQQDRSEAFISDLHGRDNRSVARAVVSDEGRIEALEVTVHANMGAWLSNFGVYIPTLSGSRTPTGVYDIQIAGLIVKGVMTNTPAVDAYRGAGRPEANYLMERLLDHIAHELGIDRFELRRRNMIKAEQIPYSMVLGGTIDSGDMPGLMEDALEKADWKGVETRRTEAAARGKKLGLGLSMYLEQCGGGEENDIELEFSHDGNLTVYASQHDNGQAHRTTLTQIVSHHLGYDVDKIHIVQGDSRRTPRGTTGGARMTAVLGSTLAEAAKTVIARASKDAADFLEVEGDDITFEDGVFSAPGTNRSISILEMVTERGQDGEPHPYSLKQSYATRGASYPYGCHIAEIEVDAATLVPEIVRYTVVDDFGVVLNPLTLEGQIHGGIAQGIGQALYEYLPYDEDGQLLAGSLMDYTLPRADHLPNFRIFTRNTPCRNNTLGVKGSGEAGAIGAPPAVISALCDALGIVHIDMPATPQAIWQRMQREN